MSSDPPEPKMKTRIVYSRDFLLSFGELEHCKRLPSGFDATLLSELQELSAGVLERNKDYYNTPLGRSDGSGGYTYSSRGGSSGGRWDTRSTGSSDRDGEVPDREPLAQGRGGNQYRRNWQNTEHDGLLGSGGFPRPSGYTGQLAQKDHGNAHQVNRTSERYQPPRPYKAAPFSRKDIDSMNDETFGFSECSNEDRAEEERKRRGQFLLLQYKHPFVFPPRSSILSHIALYAASFELMRKEQHKVMQGKKNGPDVLKESPSNDIMSQLQTPTEKLNSKTKNEKLDGSVVSSCQEDITKPSSALLAPAARPLVPPGFANAFVDKKLQSQSSNISLEPKGHSTTTEANMLTVARLGGLEVNPSATEFTAFESKEKGISDNVAIMVPKHMVPSGGVTSSTEFSSSILKGSEDWEADVMDKYSIGKDGKSKKIDPVRKDDSILILEQFFGNALSKSGSNLPTYVESQSLKTDDEMIASSVPESSKFARWFLNEDLKPAEDLSSKSLLSMIVKNENQGPENIINAPTLSDASVQNLSPKAPIDKFYSASNHLSFTSSTPADGILEQYNRSDIPETVPVMMTCEDLEETMLAQVKSNSGSTQRNAIKQHRTVVNEPVAMRKVAVDNHASQHLLSLLQKGTDNKGTSSLGFQIGSADEPQNVDTNLMPNGAISGSDPINKVNNAPSGNNLTLEALFGAAFMNELHSKDAPVSIRGPATGGPNESAEVGKTFLSSRHEEYYPVEHARSFNNAKDAAVSKEPGIEYSAVPGGLDQGNANFDKKKGLEIHLPEEDNLFTVNDSLPGQNSDILPSVRSSRVEGLLPEKAVDDLSYRLQSLVPGDAEHIQVLGPDALGSHSRDQRLQVESQNLYHLLQGRPPMMAPLSHIVNRNQQGPFDMPQLMRHDPHRSFPSNVNPMQHNLHGPGVSQLDPAAHHLMLQHMPMPGTFPTEGLPRGVLPSQQVHNMAGYRPEMGNVNNFHMHPRQPNYGEFGLMMPGPSGPEVRGNHPEAFERLIQMEMSARSKQQQVHQQAMAAGSVPGGMYGLELDTKLRYR